MKIARCGVIAIVLLFSSSAWGDVARPPREPCAPGSEAVSSHNPHCRPLKCKTSKDCKGSSCETRKLCIAMLALDGGDRPRDRPAPVVESVVGSCEGGKRCASGQCKTLKVCIAKARSESPTDAPLLRRAGCGCSVGASEAAGGAVAAVCIALFALWRARRRPR